ELDRIIQRCIERKPEDRYRTIDDLAHDLDLLVAVDDDRTRHLNPGARTERIDAVTLPITDDMVVTPAPSIDDVVTPRATVEDIALPPEEAATQFTPPPVFEPETTRPQKPVGSIKKKFISSGTLPGIIAPKKKS
ncbi:MAG: hypothetical protein ABI678_14725, partial [Kofleriaceae bacterium]